MAWFQEEKRNFPQLASRDYLPNLWLKYSRTDRQELRRGDCKAAFAALTSEMKASDSHGDRVLWTSLEDFDPETHMAGLADWLQNVKWPKVPKELRDPVSTVCSSVFGLLLDYLFSFACCRRTRRSATQRSQQTICVTHGSLAVAWTLTAFRRICAKTATSAFASTITAT